LNSSYLEFLLISALMMSAIEWCCCNCFAESYS